MNKIPKLALAFWVMKICATTLGETAGDLLSMTMNVGYALSSVILVGFFVVTLVLQMASRRYHPVLYWGVILTTSTAGTTISDFMDRSLGLGYALGSLILVTLLAGVLFVWHSTEKTLAVERVTTRRAEAFYWSAILVSNTLGTALGDYLADSSGLGFMGGALLIGALIAVLVAAVFWTKISRVFLFWAAFVLTRPFGATMGDTLTKPLSEGGLGFGTLGSSAVLLTLLVGFVVRAQWVERQRTKHSVETSVPEPSSAAVPVAVRAQSSETER